MLSPNDREVVTFRDDRKGMSTEKVFALLRERKKHAQTHEE